MKLIGGRAQGESLAHRLRRTAVERTVGGGFGAELADRGIDWLSKETREALDRSPQHVSSATLKPGETLTVVARPRASRRERKLAERARDLEKKERELSRATRRQRRSARRLRRAQRHLDSRRPGSRRWRRAAAAEAKLGRRFDAVTAPTKKLVGVRDELNRTVAELDALRTESFERARDGRPVAMSSTFHDQ